MPVVEDTVDVVRAADDVGVGLAVAHLAEQGHADIAFIDGGNGVIASDRRRGYRSAMRRQGLAAHIDILPGAHTEEAGSAAMRAVLTRAELPTAVLAFHDRCAIGAMDVLRRAGVDVPGAMSVVGYDDSPSAQLANVDLTTVNQSLAQMAEVAVALALERLDDGRRKSREVVLTPYLVVRGTTAPPARGAG